MAIKSFYRFAELSVQEKKVERFEKVMEESNEFLDQPMLNHISTQKKDSVVLC
jgi:outer membrane protein assembly factor BamD